MDFSLRSIIISQKKEQRVGISFAIKNLIDIIAKVIG
jgi:hypothetical protein